MSSVVSPFRGPQGNTQPHAEVSQSCARADARVPEIVPNVPSVRAGRCAAPARQCHTRVRNARTSFADIPVAILLVGQQGGVKDLMLCFSNHQHDLVRVGAFCACANVACLRSRRRGRAWFAQRLRCSRRSPKFVSATASAALFSSCERPTRAAKNMQKIRKLNGATVLLGVRAWLCACAAPLDTDSGASQQRYRTST